VFCLVTTFATLLMFMGMFWPHYFELPIFLLGGTHVIDNADQIVAYQTSTLAICGIAYLGAYTAIFHRMLDQLNNNDIYPISFYYYCAWFLAAIFIAAVFRHACSVFGFGDTASITLIVISFAIGAAPSPFFSYLLRWAFSKLSIVGDKGDPGKDVLPTNLNLLMIDGLGGAAIDRMAELNVTDAQVLSCQNPFVLWPRLPCEFGLIVDWIAQAQLYVILREEAFKKARMLEINDIHKFVAVLRDKDSVADICAELGLKPSFVPPLLASLEENPSFFRLREVKLAMLGKPPIAVAAPA
jgi:hypothetical protein